VTAVDRSQAIELADFQRNERDPGLVTELLESARYHCNLITPMPSCPSLPEGAEIAFTAMLVNIERDTYAPFDADKDADRRGQAGLLALHKVALEQIAAAAGVDWDAAQSYRTDDRRDLRYCSYKATGHYQDFGGHWQTITDEKEVDLRPGGAHYIDIVRMAERSNPPKSPEARLSQARKHILSNTATMAKLRAIRSLGIRASYTRDELARPFVMVKFMFTGRSDDVQLRRTFAVMQARRLMGNREAMYPTNDERTRMTVRAEAVPVDSSAIGSGATPVQDAREPSTREHGADENAQVPSAGDQRESARGPAPREAGGQTAQAPSARDKDRDARPPSGRDEVKSPTRGPSPQEHQSAGNARPPSGRDDSRRSTRGPGPARTAGRPAPPIPPPRSGHKIPWGPQKGVPIEEASDQTIAMVIDRLNQGSSHVRYERQDSELRLALIQVQDRRRDADVENREAPPGDDAGVGDDDIPY